jgi:2-dehydro-3-deoxygluconokinase
MLTTIAIALVDNPIGCLVEDLIFQGGFDTSHIHWDAFDGVGSASRNGIYFLERGFGVRPGTDVMARGPRPSPSFGPARSTGTSSSTTKVCLVSHQWHHGRTKRIVHRGCTRSHGCSRRPAWHTVESFSEMSQRVIAEFPTLRVIATTVRHDTSANRNEWSAFAFAQITLTMDCISMISRYWTASVEETPSQLALSTASSSVRASPSH